MGPAKASLEACAKYLAVDLVSGGWVGARQLLTHSRTQTGRTQHSCQLHQRWPHQHHLCTWHSRLHSECLLCLIQRDGHTDTCAQDLRESVAQQSPLKRGVEASDVGDMAAFLASDAAQTVTGQTLYGMICGVWLIKRGAHAGFPFYTVDGGFSAIASVAA